MAVTFVLVHSPSVGPSTWRPVADVLRQTGRSVVVPDLRPVADGPSPYWPLVRELVVAAVADTGDDLVLVPHSNAGLFVPVLAEALAERVTAAVFVDAALPALDGATAVAAPDWLEVLRGKVKADGRLPVWTQWFDEPDVAPMFTDPAVRATVEADQPRLPLAYYEQLVPAPPGWQQHHCAYLWFGPPYDILAAEATQRGWPVRRVPGQHLHAVVDPSGVAAAVLDLAAR
ncbi:MAG: alpha/beta hydrolase [bacterium]